MPELPEVETVATALRPHLLDRTIIRWEARRKSLREPLSQDGQPLIGQRIISVGRRGKYLLLTVENAAILLLHLGMTGELSLTQHNLPPQKHEHLEISLDNGFSLRFSDSRRFGLVRIILPSTADTTDILSGIGPEPLSREFSGKYLSGILQRRPGPIKLLLLDQALIAGIGNIYASESLFHSRIHPCRPGNSLSEKEIRSLIQSIKKTLKDAIGSGLAAIAANAPSASCPVTGTETHFPQKLFVYDREGESCLDCKRGQIRRITQGGRSSFFCPSCQDADKA